MISVEAEAALKQLGERLSSERLARNEPQARFAVRIGVSVPTLRKLEQGDPNVSLGALAQALWVLDRLGDLDGVLLPRKSLFERFEQEQAGKRLRASKRKKS